jgi:hypothetical protein
MGHNYIRSTMNYQQYALFKDKIKSLLNKIKKNN